MQEIPERDHIAVMPIDARLATLIQMPLLGKTAPAVVAEPCLQSFNPVLYSLNIRCAIIWCNG